MKLKLAKIRSSFAEQPILIIEGDDDKIIYSQWMRRLRPSLAYILHVSGGKGESIALRITLDRDTTGLDRGVYFIIDRDYDGLRGCEPRDSVFVTDRYSVENYLVTDAVVAETLRIECHCHAAPQVLGSLMIAYRKSFDDFINIVKNINFEIFCAQREQDPIRTLPKKIGKIARIDVDAASAIAPSHIDTIRFGGEISEDRRNELRAQFELMNPEHDYRGKFHLLFLKTWFERVAEMSSSDGRGLFANVGNNSKVRREEITVGVFASRSIMPRDFDEFVQRM